MHSKLQWSQFSVSCIFILSLSISYVSLSSFSTFTSCTINLSIVSRFVVRILFTLVTPVTSSHLLFHQEGDHLVLTSLHDAPSVLHMGKVIFIASPPLGRPSRIASPSLWDPAPSCSSPLISLL